MTVYVINVVAMAHIASHTIQYSPFFKIQYEIGIEVPDCRDSRRNIHFTRKSLAL